MNLAKGSVTATLVFILSGAFLLICCPEAIMAKDSCPLGSKNNHCKKFKSENGIASITKNTGSGTNCCSSLSQIFDRARKVEHPQKTIYFQAAANSCFHYALPQINGLLKADYLPTYPQNHRRIYIKNRVLRI
ncbi:MAG TPA: hypothetical protein VNK26_05630 [Pyrinomonadaceae bacterium]|nr:hypothetical protein [Pyrinomonadaceae bacterium]